MPEVTGSIPTPDTFLHNSSVIAHKTHEHISKPIHWLSLARGLQRLVRLHYDEFYTIRGGCTRARADA
jgi:hypothetical protein